MKHAYSLLTLIAILPLVHGCAHTPTPEEVQRGAERTRKAANDFCAELERAERAVADAVADGGAGGDGGDGGPGDVAAGDLAREDSGAGP